MNPLMLIFVIVLIVACLGGGHMGWYPANYGYFGGGGIVLLLIILLLLGVI